ncbi:Concanavalin-A protein [Spatholobus suberectus]|nr:Concanavalin-A protein [Spatholobus suberectus]
MLLNGANSAKTLSFTFNKFFSDQEDLILQGNATTGTESSLQLTAAEGGRVGRALYYAPVRLWESSAVVASFQTTFTFAITSSPGSSPADGLAFFIASPDTTIPPNSDGKLLGLFPNTNALKNSSSNQQITTIGFPSSMDFGVLHGLCLEKFYVTLGN